jgi:hypothetical protein
MHDTSPLPASTHSTHSAHRTAALALLTGVLLGAATMALHPTGRDVVDNASAGAPNTLAAAVHALALLALGLQLAGTLALPSRLEARRDVAVGGCVFFALAVVAGLVAAAASGFMAPAAVRGLGGADEATRAAMLGALRFTRLLNQAFAQLYVVLSGAALLLWSSAILGGRGMPRPLGLFGVLVGLGLPAAALSGHLRLGIHGFGLVVLAEGLWLCGAAALLWRAPAPGTRPGGV